MKNIKELLPWKVTDISICPYDGFWSFNPSIHYDGMWRCVLRCCDYAMPGGVTVRSKNAGPVGQQTKNAMVILDPTSWDVAQVFKMHERDGLPRESCPHVGYEDMRIFKTAKAGLQGIAASLHLRRDARRISDGVSQHQPPEQVLLSFDEHYNIIAAHPIRGAGWSGTPQKNWVPFDQCTSPRFLYSIEKGVLFDASGALHGEDACVTPLSGSVDAASFTASATGLSERPKLTEASSPKTPARKHSVRGGDVRIVRGGRLALDASASRPSSRPPPRSIPGKREAPPVMEASSRVADAGRTILPKYEGLRGGTQLCFVGEGTWLGVGHEMKFVGGKKYYWHVFYLVNAQGNMLAASEPLKLASHGIEFAAGMALDGDRLVISFGVDDMESKLGETSLSAVMGILRQVT